MNSIAKLAIVTAVLTLVGCASMSKQQCMTKDWHQAGYQDGSSGQFRSNLAKENNACSRYKIEVDHQAYGQGWEAGVAQFCQPSRAMNMGINGEQYNPVCPPSLAAAFESTWRDGLRQFCVPQQGYKLGRSGKPLPNFCAPELAGPFTIAFQDGYRLYQQISEIQGEIKRINDDIDSRQNDINNRQRDVDRWISKLSDPKVLADPIAVESIRVKVKENNKQIQRHQSTLRRLSMERHGADSRLQRVNAQG